VPRRFALPAPAGQRGHGATVPPRKLKWCSASIIDNSYPKTPKMGIRELTERFERLSRFETRVFRFWWMDGEG
jgi:hypothetical protein